MKNIKHKIKSVSLKYFPWMVIGNIECNVDTYINDKWKFQIIIS